MTLPAPLETYLREIGVREPLALTPAPVSRAEPHHPEIAAWIRNPVGEPPW